MPSWFFTSLRGYRIAWLPRDLVAGLMLLAIALPGQLATARLAGMPPETGLYAFVAGSLAFAAFGANRFMSVAADSTIAPIFAGGLAAIVGARSASYPELATLLALLVGVVLVVVGLLRAGWLATLLSIPITTGFLAGISVHIIVGELPTLLGVPNEQGHVLERLVHTLGQVGHTNPYPLGLGAGVLIVTIGTARISSRVPGALIGLVGAGLAVAFFHLGARGVSLLGALSVRLPGLALPALPGMGELGRTIQLALVVAMVCIMQTSAVASTFPSDEGKPDDISRNFVGVGLGSILAGVIGAFAVDASPPSTAIVKESGGRSQFASLTAAALMVALAALAAGLTAYLPHAALSGVLVYIALRIFRVDEMIRIYRRSRFEILLVAASAGLVIALPIETGMLLAIVLSFVHSLYIIARPYCVELARVPGSTVWWPPTASGQGEHEAGVLVFAPSAPLNFTNAEHICGKIMSTIAAQSGPVRLLVIEANGIIDIDYTGSQTLSRAITNLRARNIDVAIARLSDGRAQAQAGRTGLIDAIGLERVFMSVEEAIQKLGPRAQSRVRV
jgi:MFS superfamily sulfate permease-like transporter